MHAQQNGSYRGKHTLPAVLHMLRDSCNQASMMLEVMTAVSTECENAHALHTASDERCPAKTSHCSLCVSYAYMTLLVQSDCMKVFALKITLHTGLSDLVQEHDPLSSLF